MSTKMVLATVVSQEQLLGDVYSMWLDVGDMAGDAKAGQFIALYSSDHSRLLPRPISICEVAPEKGSLRIVYRVVGKGTEEFSGYQAGDPVRITGPLGNGYPLLKAPAILVAGGIGIPPMLELARRLDCEKTIVLGYKDKLFLNKDFEPYGKVVISTEDGSCGVHGNALDAIREAKVTGQVIYSCGPTPMLRAVKAYAEAQGIEAYISLEEKMACGIGACLACVCNSTEVDDHSHVHNKRICKDGPVFNTREVIL